jgi:hypothetical protein
MYIGRPITKKEIIPAGFFCKKPFKVFKNDMIYSTGNKNMASFIEDKIFIRLS